jgi:hypothetical protein
VIEILAVLHLVIVTLPVWETDIVGLRVPEMHPDTVPVEQALGVFVTVMVPVSHTLTEREVVADELEDKV